MKKILAPAMLALLLFTAGCEKPPADNPPENPPDKTVQTKPDESRLNLKRRRPPKKMTPHMP